MGAVSGQSTVGRRLRTSGLGLGRILVMSIVTMQVLLGVATEKAVMDW